MSAAIVYETGDYYAVRAPYGFAVFRNGATAAVRVAQIGFHGAAGWARMVAEIERRIAADKSPRHPLTHRK